MNRSFKVEVSARHVHLNRAAIDVLFGQGYELSVRKNLSQPGQFVCLERVDVVGPKNVIKNVSVLGPERSCAQVEVSATDARKLGVEVQIRESGDVNGTPGCELVGSKGSIKIEKGLIVAKRHIHANLEEAGKLNVKNGQIVWVKVLSNQRQLVFGEVVVRVSDAYALAMHIDTDEGNAACCDAHTVGELVDLF